MTNLPRNLRSGLLTLGALALGCALLGGACSGGGGEGEAFFDPETIDEYLDDLLPTTDDLPGSGWEETARSIDGEEDEGGGEFEEFLATAPACSDLAALSQLGGIFGGDAEEPPVASAKVEFERAAAGSLIPTSVETEIEIEETRNEVEGSWGVVKELLEAPATSACFEEIFNAAFTSNLDQEGAPAGVEANLASISPSASAPQDGAALAFSLEFAVLGIEIDGVIELYFWPYGNAKVTTLIFSQAGALSSGETGDILNAIDRRLVAEEEEY